MLLDEQSPKKRRAEATVRIGTAFAIPDVLKSLGADPAEVVARAGLDLALFSDPDNLISFAARGRLLSHCVDATGCPHFGLLVGQRGGLHSLGFVGLLAKNSVDVATALKNLIGFFSAHSRGSVTRLEVDGDVALLSFSVIQPDIEAVDQACDAAVAIFFNMMRGLCGPGWRPIEARFDHRRPEDVRPFRQFFGAPLQFDAKQSALVFSADWLRTRLPDADAELVRLLHRQLDALQSEHADDFPEQVRRVLATALLTGHASADQVAALFAMHSRTMNRRLQAFGVSFQELVDEGRYAIARRMLEHGSLDVNEIAAALDYADASAFTRAFRRWSGTTPAAWRARRARPT
jgi:AraC-like DNA-binding protein